MRILCLVCLMLISAVSWAASIPGEPLTQSEETAFVEYVLRAEYTSSISNSIPLVLYEELGFMIHPVSKSTADCTTQLIQGTESPEKKLTEAIQDFCAKNLDKITIDAIGHLTIKHIVMTAKQRSDLFENQDGWDKFYKLYPESPGIVTFSRPGFSTDRTLAIIYIGNQSHYLSGAGGIRIYHKKDGKWVVDKDKGVGPMWMS